ncbi:MAG: SDR family oxidoreductase [Alphaproteobacteria bacterium]|nr:SDR family oxidoreductase [Alphaproteobacteria bacterium]
MTDRFLAGRAALVTGGASGMGRAMALALAGAGCDVAIGSLLDERPLGTRAYTHLPSAADLCHVAGEVIAQGVRCHAAPLDVRDDNSVAGFIEDTQRALGPVDILVNAAGVCAQDLVVDMDDATWHMVLDVNLNGAYRTIKRCLPGMIERRRGRIVNLGSTASRVGWPRFAAYCASKHALLGLTRCVALEGAAHGVSCNAINPGYVDTGLTRRGSVERVKQGGQGVSVEENLKTIAMTQPQLRLIPAEEIGGLALHLCRDEAFGITGQDIQVSGGTLW